MKAYQFLFDPYTGVYMGLTRGELGAASLNGVTFFPGNSTPLEPPWRDGFLPYWSFSSLCWELRARGEQPVREEVIRAVRQVMKEEFIGLILAFQPALLQSTERIVSCMEDNTSSIRGDVARFESRNRRTLDELDRMIQMNHTAATKDFLLVCESLLRIDRQTSPGFLSVFWSYLKGWFS